MSVCSLPAWWWFSLSRHDGGAPTDGGAAQVARCVAALAVEGLDVSDEVAHDVGRVVARDRVVALALARVVEPVALAGPSGDVEVGEVLDRDLGAGAGAAVLE